jgi:hypothetical protein
MGRNSDKGRIKKTEFSTNPNSKIKSTKLGESSGISFSYKYFQADHSTFCCKSRDTSYFLVLLERLRDLSRSTALELKQCRSSSLRCHPIKWSDTTQDSFGIPNEEQLIDIPYQFSLSSNEHGRVHGFFIEEIFYVVWLDPNHDLYF